MISGRNGFPSADDEASFPSRNTNDDSAGYTTPRPADGSPSTMRRRFGPLTLSYHVALSRPPRWRESKLVRNPPRMGDVRARRLGGVFAATPGRRPVEQYRRALRRLTIVFQRGGVRD